MSWPLHKTCCLCIHDIVYGQAQESMNYGSEREVGHSERFSSINLVVASNAHRIIQRMERNLSPRRDITQRHPHFKVPLYWRILLIQSIRSCWFLVVKRNLTHFFTMTSITVISLWEFQRQTSQRFYEVGRRWKYDKFLFFFYRLAKWSFSSILKSAQRFKRSQIMKTR